MMVFREEADPRHAFFQDSYSHDGARGGRDAHATDALSKGLGAPLASLILLTEVLQKSGGNSRRAHYARCIQKSALKISDTLGGLMEISSGTLAKQLHVEPCDLRDVLAEACLPFKSRPFAPCINIINTPYATTAWFDRRRVVTALRCLLDNATKFTSAAGTIDLWARRTRDGTKISVSDTGVGIPRSHQASLFEPFWRAPSHNRPSLKTGLYVTRSIVEAHGGVLSMESRLGSGSTFNMWLPNTQDPHSDASPSTGNPVAYVWPSTPKRRPTALN